MQLRSTEWLFNIVTIYRQNEARKAKIQDKREKINVESVDFK